MTRSLFDSTPTELKAIAELRKWGPREPLDHGKLNEPVEAINKLVRGVTPARQRKFVSPPAGSAVTFCVVRNAAPSAASDRVIQISLVEASDLFPEGEAFTIDSEVVMANTWPPLRGRHYAAFVWESDSIQDETNVLPAVNINDAWWVMQQLTWGSLDSVSDIPLSDCQV